MRVAAQLALLKANRVFLFHPLSPASVGFIYFFFFIDFTYEYIMMIKDTSVMNVGKPSFVMITLRSTRRYTQVRRIL